MEFVIICHGQDILHARDLPLSGATKTYTQ
jgi:hypothetical protein